MQEYCREFQEFLHWEFERRRKKKQLNDKTYHVLQIWEFIPSSEKITAIVITHSETFFT